MLTPPKGTSEEIIRQYVVGDTAQAKAQERKDSLRKIYPHYPILTDVPVFMPVSFEIHPGDACLVIFSDVDIDNWFETGEASAPNSPRRHSLSDGFAFVGFRVPENQENGG